MLLSATGCKNGGQSDGILTIYENEDLNTSIRLTKEIIGLPYDDIYAEKYWMVSDSMLLIERRKAENFLDIINPITGEKYSSLLSYGEGPENIIFCGLYYDGDYITAVDYIRSKYAKFAPQDAAKTNFTPNFISFPREIGVTTPPIMIGESTYIVNPFYYINKSNDIKQDLDRFIVLDNSKPDSVFIEFGELYTQNVSQVIPLVDEKNRYLWLFSQERPLIEIYDYEKNKLKSIKFKGELDNDPDVIIDNGEVIYYKKIPRSFTNAVIDYGNEEILAVYCGRLCEPEELEKLPSKILVFDFDGNLKRNYQCDSYIYELSKTSDDLYATILDDDGMSVFVRLRPQNEL